MQHDFDWPDNLALRLPPPPASEVARLLIADLEATNKPKLMPLLWRLRQWWKNVRDGSYLVPWRANRIRRKYGIMVGYGELYGRIVHKDGTTTDLGLLGRRLVTDAGVAYLAADVAAGASDMNLMKFHGYGTGTTAEAANQTALVTELTTEYVVNSTRPTGSQSSSTNVYTTVGTLSPDSGGTLAITEHGIFSANAAGTLWDRTKFTAVNLDSTAGDSLQTTYNGTFPSGG